MEVTFRYGYPEVWLEWFGKILAVPKVLEARSFKSIRQSKENHRTASLSNGLEDPQKSPKAKVNVPEASPS